MTYEDWQFKARKDLITVGIEQNEAYVIARKLLDFHTGIERSALLHGDTVIVDRASLDALLEEAIKRRPLPHILGNAPFWDLTLEVSEATLIPRPETEFLVEAVLKQLGKHTKPLICDLGTGTGAIAITLALARPDSTVLALELSSEAREVAERNIKSDRLKCNDIKGKRRLVFSPDFSSNRS
jgi:release factor glutamine methyltransferase